MLEQKERLCELWYAHAPIKNVLVRAGNIVGGKVDQNKINCWCELRDGSQRSNNLK
jgi:hypothetical protein